MKKLGMIGAVVVMGMVATGCNKKHNPLGLMREENAEVVKNGQFDNWTADVAALDVFEIGPCPAVDWITHGKEHMSLTIEKYVESGDRALKLTVTQMDLAWGNQYAVVQQIYPNYAAYAGKTVTLQARVKTTHPGVQLSIGTQAGIYKSFPHSGSGQWETLTITRPIPQNITQFYITVGFDAVPGVNGVMTDPPTVGAWFIADDVFADAE